MLGNAHPNKVGDTAMVGGHHIETHTIGCRNAADTHPDRWWDEHWEIHDELSKDPNTYIMGDPADGKFVSVTVPREKKHESRSDELITNRLREK